MASRKRLSGIKREEGIWESLMKLRAMTQELGALHEGQVNQLKIWGQLAFDFADDVEIAVALPHLGKDDEGLIDENRVEYRVRAKGKPPANFRNVLGGLHRSVIALLGDYFTLTVLINGTAILQRKGKAKKKRNVAKILKRLKETYGSSQ